MIDLELLGLPTACWKCGRSTVALVAVSPSGARGDDELLQTDEPAALAFAAAHLPVGVSHVGEIRERSSRAAGAAYLSNGCFHCDALLGNFFLFHEELLEVLVASRRVVGIEHAILGGDQSEGVSSLTDASSLSTTE
jgi:hypothetical protein